MPAFCLSIILVGMPIIYVLREYLVFVDEFIVIPRDLLTYGIMFFCILQQFSISNVARLRFFITLHPIVYLFIIANILFFLINFELEGPLLEHSSAISMFVMIALFIALLTRPNSDYALLPFYALIVSSVATYLSILSTPTDAAYWATRGNRFFVGDTANPNITSFSALMNVALCIYYVMTNRLLRFRVKLGLYFTALLSSYLYFLSFSKSSIIGLVLVLLYIASINIRIATMMSRNTIMYGGIGFILVAVLVPNLLQRLSEKFDVYVLAYFSYFYGEDGVRSAEVRYNNLQMARQWFVEADWFSGRGIFKSDVDLPALEIFTDLGYIPGSINLACLLLIPLIIVSRNWLAVLFNGRRVFSDLFMFSMITYLFFMPNVFLHGSAYHHSVWLPLFILIKFATPSVRQSR